MFIKKIILFLLLVISLTGCKEKSKIEFVNFANKYQLNQTTNYSYEFERAILYANSILEDTFKYRLVPTWETSILCPKFSFYKFTNNSKMTYSLKDLNDSIKECKYTNYFPIPVYLINDEKLGGSENIFVPDNEKCIFVNTRFITSLWKDFGILWYSPDRRHSITLSLILLHELGHLNNGDEGSYTKPEAIEINSNGTLELSKNKEYNADMFAINELKRANLTNDTASFREKVVFMSNTSLVGDFYRAISYGRSEFEINKDVLGIFNGKHTLLNFKTNSYSHPNLYFRFLLMSYSLNPDKEISEIIKNAIK